jgi:DNA-binding Xre family transcriptional regulator
MPMATNFAKLLEEKEKQEGRYIPLAEVAQKSRVTRKTLYSWQNNTVTRFDAKVIDALCDYFGVEMNELLVHTPKTKRAAR